ncbi:MAG: hypothetical protein AABZ50_01335 [Pseudomonadota bacterium]
MAGVHDCGYTLPCCNRGPQRGQFINNKQPQLKENPMGGTGGIITLIYLAIIIFLIASFWKVFTKAG